MIKDQSSSLEYTRTWVVAFITFIIILLSLFAERGLHYLGKYLKRRRKDALFEALQKLKEELMLLGFISLMLTVSQNAISRICVPPAALASNMIPCRKPLETHHVPESSHTLTINARHLLSTGASPDHCARKGQVPLVSVEALHQLHIFIFVLAVFHVIFCASTMVLGRARIQQWRHWEERFKKLPSQKDASKPGHQFFAKHAEGFWRISVVISWMRSFFKQFYGSVTKSEYIALRQGFIMTHCPGVPSFNFHKYMLRIMENDFIFKKVVRIRWHLWLFVVVFLLLNVRGWNTYFWLSVLTLIGCKFEQEIFNEELVQYMETWLKDTTTRNKGESTSEARRMEKQPTIPESSNVQVNEVMECENP